MCQTNGRKKNCLWIIRSEEERKGSEGNWDPSQSALTCDMAFINDMWLTKELNCSICAYVVIKIQVTCIYRWGLWHFVLYVIYCSSFPFLPFYFLFSVCTNCSWGTLWVGATLHPTECWRRIPAVKDTCWCIRVQRG